MISDPSANGTAGSSDTTLPNSRRVYVPGEQHPDVRVPFREIGLSPTKNFDGRLEPNEPVRVYDTSGPWGDGDFRGDVERGLPALRREWILGRGDVAEYDGRTVRPEDNGYLSGVHADHAAKRNGKAALKEFPGLRRKPLRASAGHPVSQLWYARQAIVTPEMEFIAIRENMGRAKLVDMAEDIDRQDLRKQNAGSTQLVAAVYDRRTKTNDAHRAPLQEADYASSVFRRFP
ncbi:MAG: phosphomethylpyrimidine synthase, partial [Chthoniobacterales bacterium]